MADDELQKEIADLSPEDKKVVMDEVQRVFGEQKIGNVHEFLRKVIEEQDTTKLGNITKDELGTPLHTLRTYKQLEIMANTFDMPEFASYFKQLSTGVVTSPSLSKEGFLLLLSITERRNLQARLPSGEKKQNSGWFRSKNQPSNIQESNI